MTLRRAWAGAGGQRRHCLHSGAFPSTCHSWGLLARFAGLRVQHPTRRV